VNAGEDSCLRGKIAATAAAVALTIALGAVDYLTGREWAITAFLPVADGPRGVGGGPLVGIGCGSVVHWCMVPQ
jgi:hypothetical protein